MNSHWYESQPSMLVDIEQEIELNFPRLRVLKVDGNVEIKGILDIFDEDLTYYDSYCIRIVLADDHPKTFPLIFETGGRIPQKASRHINDNHSLCLFVPFERKIYWPAPHNISQLIGGPINAYFYGQTYYERYGKYPFGERSHNIAGVLEAINEHSGMETWSQVLCVLDLLNKPHLKGHWLCPCGSNKSLRKCHLHKILFVKDMINEEEMSMIMFEYQKLEDLVVEQRRKEQLVLEKIANGIF